MFGVMVCWLYAVFRFVCWISRCWVFRWWVLFIHRHNFVIMNFQLCMLSFAVFAFAGIPANELPILTLEIWNFLRFLKCEGLLLSNGENNLKKWEISKQNCYPWNKKGSVLKPKIKSVRSAKILWKVERLGIWKFSFLKVRKITWRNVEFDKESVTFEIWTD